MTIVILIIGILSAALIPKLTAAQSRARDTAREADSRNIAAALELYINDNNGIYPSPIYYDIAYTDSTPNWISTTYAQGLQAVSTVSNLTGLKLYIDSIPQDPSGAWQGATSDGNCREIGKSYAYHSNTLGTMFAITSTKESKKGNSISCNGTVEVSPWSDFPYLTVGQWLIYSGQQINIPWNPWNPQDPGNPWNPQDPWNPWNPWNPWSDIKGDDCFDIMNVDWKETIINYHSESTFCPKAVTILSSIGGKTIQAIGDTSFSNKVLTSISVPSSVTSIGISAFAYNNISTMSIPSGISSISNGMYRNNNISSITIPATITSIAANAFANNNLSYFSLPSTVSSFDGSAVAWNWPSKNSNGISDFVANTNQQWILVDNIRVKSTNDACFSINMGTITNYYSYEDNNSNNPLCPRDVVIGSQIKNQTVIGLGDYSLYNRNITSIILPATLQSINWGALRSNNISSVTIPNSVSNISETAFYDNLLTSITIPDSVITIWESAFEQNNLQSVIIWNSVKTIGATAFNNRYWDHTNHPPRENKITLLTLWNSLETIGNAAFNGQSIAEITFPNSLKTIGEYAFAGNPLSILHIPSSVTSIHDNAFIYNGPNPLTYSPWLTQFVSGTDQNWTFNVSRNRFVKDWVWDESCFSFDGSYITDYDSACQTDNVIVPASLGGQPVIGIASRALYNKGIKSLVLENGIQEIWAHALRSNLFTSLIIPDSVTIIWDFAFYEGLLQSVTVNQVKIIWEYAFYANKLESVIIWNGVEEIKTNAFGNYTTSASDPQWNQIKTVDLWNSVKIIWHDAFFGHQLESLFIPNSVDFIGQSAFAWAWNPTDWRYNSRLSSVTLWSSVKTIKSFAFVNNRLTSITIPDSVETIETYAFEGNKLETVVIGNGVKTIGEVAFGNRGWDNNISSLILWNSIISIGDYAFSSSSISSITIPSTTTSIGEQAFSNNRLIKLILPSNVSSVGENTFQSNWPNKDSYAIGDFVPNTYQTWNISGLEWIKE